MRNVLALLTDVMVILVFILISRVSHGRSLAPTLLWADVWPFLVGLGIGWLVTRSWRDTLSELAALGVWACTMLGGFIPRFLAGPRLRPADVLVAAMVLGFLFGGWRLFAFLNRSLAERRAVGLPVD